MNQNAVVCIHRPELTEKEREMREQNILTALQQFGKAMQDTKRKGEIHNAQRY